MKTVEHELDSGLGILKDMREVILLVPGNPATKKRVGWGCC